ncbi:ABC transporter substrate-binding protein [Sphingomonas immobilis]|uniref:ABC transporter substrate-binding protein n=1 Tax=Sphingomonas immobilis TaxID=3063997 RepID=A0ABT8ZUW0_9SPHN|nr:ABC transporter substrate-binding protein [Sphingomonas sp. CA1-15]MDO7841053.1 ABC transporter substrate-binding protein [Sphingomonas sp. CA1-15]
MIVSAIGGSAHAADPSAGRLDTPDRLMLDATAQGLVRFDASGQIEPGVAERWTVIDGGMSYIFRLRDAEWSDGKPVTAGEVVTILRRQLGRGSRNDLKPFLSAIEEIVEMTPEVIEVRLSRPRPDLLKLFAQPELAIFRVRPPGGSGPFRNVSTHDRFATLRPVFDPTKSDDEDAAEPPPEATVLLIGERASKAVLRFKDRKSHLVTGGTFADWPLVALADLAPANVRLDPAAGLFGFAVADRTGFLADAANRTAVAQAIDRDAIVAAFAPGWAATTTILPEQLDSTAAPATPGWAGDATAIDGAAQVTAWKSANPGPLTLRIALPAGPGATILYGHVGAALLRIGITPVRVPIGADADLRLVDAVAPYDSARWYLGTACQPCGTAAQTAIEAARDAPTLSERSRHLAEADAAMAADVAFIPVARPLRWSLVSLRLKAWTGNSRAWHPLNRLRADTN